ncbi:hypothetical protein [Labrenzia sp. THAF82]|uniref:hypothetical protein n=1 Tax=Labrenzia sp. THAF82 TaxID=2587861 RepID=UPI001268C8FC|nr:hypothetical protein [Labrenzia sp. THAF82]
MLVRFQTCNPLLIGSNGRGAACINDTINKLLDLTVNFVKLRLQFRFRYIRLCLPLIPRIAESSLRKFE